MHEEQEKMLKALMALEFMAIDLNLYLNTHPDDYRALVIFTGTVQRINIAKAEYEQLYGPITASAGNSFPWPWIRSPWPWE